jgi:hypothetical protein
MHHRHAAVFCGRISTGTVEGSCNDVTIKGSSIPPFDQDLYNVTSQCLCLVVVGNSGNTMKARMYLQRLNSSGQFVNVYSFPQYPPNNTWPSLSYGTYRVKVSIPKAVVALNCISGWVNCINLAGQYVGRKGYYPDIEEGENRTVFYSNAVLVGNTVPADNNYDFTEGKPSGGGTAMDSDEDVGMDASASSNYDQWFLAICEQSFDDCLRYKSNGWTNGTVGQFDLKEFWESGGWQFQEWMSYEVQFVVENSKCRNGVEMPPPWNVNYESFFICGAGTGCRFGAGEKEITIGPNPAGSFVRLGNFDPAIDRDFVMSFNDLSGRTVKSVPLVSEQVDISDLPGGMYAVNVLRDGHRLFTAKLIVNNH